MAAIYIVTYQATNAATGARVLAELKRVAGWAKLTDTSYAITSSRTPQQVYERFEALLGSEDTLYVFTVRRPYYGQGLSEVNEWLSKHLPT